MHTTEPTLDRRQFFDFLALPYHIRHDIYTLVLEYPDLDSVFARVASQCAEDELKHEETRLPKCVMPSPHVAPQLKTTPGILLCNRQVAWEAREAMHFKTFTLRRPPPHTTALGKPMDITEFVSEGTLKKMRRVEFVMNLWFDPRGWSKTIEVLLDVWSVENHLRKINITLEQPTQLPAGQFWNLQYPGQPVKILSMIKSFAEVAGICLTGTPLSTLNVKKANADW
ncbi:hypothetical protein BKA67DRAFT_664545 [Truncatella angustata]|uniref:Uncharacterized protein n=1 Tax=Truncatella angustata TaxID=152316 RepID=A0A9P8UBK0_9PEZI|nr:uncharacterized protein BKA67DRAFT_664545 [Truncatella angustata]KAH6645471.1 hypothetical protein BKA67DRAFT_664545 [Truncatella angustata]KAH8200918.1 hypothetical protein TruAng_004927 [Truncatella angustata]